MAEMVGSIVVGEVVNRTSSFLFSKRRERPSTREGVERLDMAHIKMEAALEVSGRWHAAADDASLLRWRRKLRHAADECDAALCRWKLRALLEEEAAERLARAPFRSRVAHAVACFVSALLVLARGSGDESSRAWAAVHRFERLASGAAEFLRCVEVSSAPWRCTLLDFDPVARKLSEDVNCGRLQQGARRHRCLGAGSKSPAAEGWVETKRCRGYGKRRASAENLLQDRLPSRSSEPGSHRRSRGSGHWSHSHIPFDVQICAEGNKIRAQLVDRG